MEKSEFTAMVSFYFFRSVGLSLVPTVAAVAPAVIAVSVAYDEKMKQSYILLFIAWLEIE